MNSKGLFSSNSNEWATPKEFFNELNKEFNFTLDPCANRKNYKCKKYFTEKQNGLIQDWSNDIVFCNPPYGRQINKWVEKAFNENKKGATVVMLLPARTDTKYFHEFIYNQHEIRFIKGRLHFNDSKHGAPFPSMLIIMKKLEVEE